MGKLLIGSIRLLTTIGTRIMRMGVVMTRNEVPCAMRIRSMMGRAIRVMSTIRKGAFHDDPSWILILSKPWQQAPSLPPPPHRIMVCAIPIILIRIRHNHHKPCVQQRKRNPR
jgi:hypothetical protein